MNAPEALRFARRRGHPLSCPERRGTWPDHGLTQRPCAPVARLFGATP
jgi:hypothetical protein